MLRRKQNIIIVSHPKGFGVHRRIPIKFYLSGGSESANLII